MVEFTAAWCPTCKWNLYTAINTHRVKELVEANKVEPLLADWTSKDEVIKRQLAEIVPGGDPRQRVHHSREDGRPPHHRGAAGRAG